MKLIVLALIFQFVISCWPKTNKVSLNIIKCFGTRKPAKTKNENQVRKVTSGW